MGSLVVCTGIDLLYSALRCTLFNPSFTVHLKVSIGLAFYQSFCSTDLSLYLSAHRVLLCDYMASCWLVVFLPISLFICLSVCLSVCLSIRVVCLFHCPFFRFVSFFLSVSNFGHLRLSVGQCFCLSLHSSACPTIPFLFVCTSACTIVLSNCLPVSLSLHLSVCLSYCLSVCVTCLSLSLDCLSICLVPCLSLSICMSLSLSVFLSDYLFFFELFVF